MSFPWTSRICRGQTADSHQSYGNSRPACLRETGQGLPRHAGDFPSPWRFRLLTDEPTTGALHSLPSVGSIRPGTSVYPRGPDSRFAGRDRRSTAPSVGQSAPCEILRVPVASPSFDVVTIAVTGLPPESGRPYQSPAGEPPCERSRRGWESTTSKPVSRHLDAQPG